MLTHRFAIPGGQREWRKRIDDEPGPVVNPVATRGPPPTSLSRPRLCFWSLLFCLYKPKKDSSFLGLVMERRGEKVTGRCVSGRMAIDGGDDHLPSGLYGAILVPSALPASPLPSLLLFLLLPPRSHRRYERFLGSWASQKGRWCETRSHAEEMPKRRGIGERAMP